MGERVAPEALIYKFQVGKLLNQGWTLLDSQSPRQTTAVGSNPRLCLEMAEKNVDQLVSMD